MAKVLDVYLLNELVGQLIQHDTGALGFEYHADWLANKEAIPLSQSLPLQSEAFTDKQCHGFFGGILPEEGKRDLIAKNLGVSKKNDFTMLAEIGGECGGAVSFVPVGETPVSEHYMKLLSDDELADILKDLPKRPMMAGQEGIRLSLAGAQDKLTVHKTAQGYSIPLYDAPSTHILKPVIKRFADSVMNEAFCMRLAKAIGLNVAPVEVITIGDVDVLSVERYDRNWLIEDFVVERLHQEDFCQAMGIVSEMKYQSEGGPSLADCFSLLRQVSSVPVLDLQQLLNCVIFNFLIGNNDAHGKNFSLLYDDGQTRLAPFYDLLCTAYYPELAEKMAMKIGSKYKPEEVRASNFEQLADAAGLSKPMVLKRVQDIGKQIITKADAVWDETEASEKLADFIKGRVSEMLSKLT